jgi:hypothetical protein
MPTLSDNITFMRSKKISNEGIRQAQEDTFGVPASELVPYLDNDVRDIPGLLAGRQSNAAVDTVASALPFVSREALTVPRAKPVPALDLPDTGDPEGEMPDGVITRRSDLLDKGAQVLGAVTGAAWQAGKTVVGQGNAEAIAAARAGIAKERARKLSQSTGKTLFEDVGNIITGIPTLAINTLGSFELDPNEPALVAGNRSGQALVNAGLAAVQELVTSPGETMRAAPISTLLNAIPAARALSASAKAAPKGSALGRMSLVADENLAKLRNGGGMLLTKVHPTLRQQWFDLFDAGDPRINQFLEEALQGTEARMSTAAREIPEMAAESAAVRRRLDNPQSRAPFIDAADLEIEAEQAAKRAAKAERDHGILVAKQKADRQAAAAARIRAAKAPAPPALEMPPATPEPPAARPAAVEPPPVTPEPPLRPRVAPVVDAAPSSPAAIAPTSIWDEPSWDSPYRYGGGSGPQSVGSAWGLEASRAAFAEVDEAVAGATRGLEEARNVRFKEALDNIESLKTMTEDASGRPMTRARRADHMRDARARLAKLKESLAEEYRSSVDGAKAAFIAEKRAGGAGAPSAAHDIADLAEVERAVIAKTGTIRVWGDSAAERRAAASTEARAAAMADAASGESRAVTTSTPQETLQRFAAGEFTAEEVAAFERQADAEVATKQFVFKNADAEKAQLRANIIDRIKNDKTALARDTIAGTANRSIWDDLALRPELLVGAKVKHEGWVEALTTKWGEEAFNHAVDRAKADLPNHPAAAGFDLDRPLVRQPSGYHDAVVQSAKDTIAAERAKLPVSGRPPPAVVPGEPAALPAAPVDLADVGPTMDGPLSIDRPPAAPQGPAPADIRAAAAADRVSPGEGKKLLARARKARDAARAEAEKAAASAKAARDALPPEDLSNPVAEAAASPARRRFEAALGTSGDEDSLSIGYPGIGEPLPSRPLSDKRPVATVPGLPTEAGAARDAAVDVRANLAAEATTEGANNTITAATRQAQGVQVLSFANEEKAKIPLWLDNSGPAPAIIPMTPGSGGHGWVNGLADSVGLLDLQPHRRRGSLGFQPGEGGRPTSTTLSDRVDGARGPEVSLRSVWQHIQDVKRDNPAAFKAFPQAAQDLARMRPVKVGDVSILANPQVAYAVETVNGVREANRLLDSVVWSALTSLGKRMKQVALPLSVKAMVGNFIGNEALTSLFAGRAPMQTATSGVLLARSAKKYWATPAAERAALKDARFFAAFDRTGAINANLAVQELNNIESIGTNAAAKGFDKLADAGGKFMAKTDEIAKLSVGRTSFDRAVGMLDAMEPGSVSRVRTTPRTTTVVTRNADGTYTIKTPLREVTVPAGSEALDDVAAQWAAFKTKSLYFDYGGDLAGWPRTVRESPAAAAAPFFTWGFRALDVPGFKRGLGTAVLEGPLAGFTTNSRAANKLLAWENAKIFMARATLLAVMPNRSKDNQTLAAASSYTNSDQLARVVSATTNPGTLSVSRFSSANWLGPDLELWGGIASLLDRALSHTDDKLENLGKKMAARSKAQRDGDEVIPEVPADDINALIERSHDANPYSRMLSAVGMGGRIAFNTIADMTDPKKNFTVGDALAKHFYPSTLKAAVDFGSDLAGVTPESRLVDAPMDETQRAGRTEHLVRQLFGIGWDTIDSHKALDRYTNDVTKSLNDQADQWLTKREAEIARKNGDAEDMREAYKLHGQIKGAIALVRGQATKDWVEAQRRLVLEQRQKVTPAQLRQKAAQQKVGGAK